MARCEWWLLNWTALPLNRPLFWVYNDTVSLDVCVCVYFKIFFFIWHQVLVELLGIFPCNVRTL